MRDVVDIHGIANCDGCNQPMDWKQYENHECLAYKDSEFKNPLQHKSSVAVWKTPKGKVVARGHCLTKEDIEMIQQRKPPETGSGVKSYLNPKTDRGKRSIRIIVVVAIGIIIAAIAAG